MIAAERIQDARAALLAIDVESATEVLADVYQRRRDARAEREARRGRPRSVNCFICGRWKSRPSTTCGHCGDQPVTHNGDPREFDEAHYGERVLA